MCPTSNTKKEYDTEKLAEFNVLDENDVEYRNIMKKLLVFQIKKDTILNRIDKERHNLETVLSSLNEYNNLANEINKAVENYMRKRRKSKLF